MDRMATGIRFLLALVFLGRHPPSRRCRFLDFDPVVVVVVFVALVLVVAVIV